jgi:hypothetical protein
MYTQFGTLSLGHLSVLSVYGRQGGYGTSKKRQTKPTACPKRQKMSGISGFRVGVHLLPVRLETFATTMGTL